MLEQLDHDTCHRFSWEGSTVRCSQPEHVPLRHVGRRTLQCSVGGKSAESAIASACPPGIELQPQGGVLDQGIHQVEGRNQVCKPAACIIYIGDFSTAVYRHAVLTAALCTIDRVVRIQGKQVNLGTFVDEMEAASAYAEAAFAIAQGRPLMLPPSRAPRN